MNNKIVRKQAREVEIGSKYFLTVSQARDLTVTPVSLPNVPLFSSLLLLRSSLNTVQAHKEAALTFPTLSCDRDSPVALALTVLCFPKTAAVSKPTKV